MTHLQLRIFLRSLPPRMRSRQRWGRADRFASRIVTVCRSCSRADAPELVRDAAAQALRTLDPADLGICVDWLLAQPRWRGRRAFDAADRLAFWIDPEMHATYGGDTVIALRSLVATCVAARLSPSSLVPTVQGDHHAPHR